MHPDMGMYGAYGMGMANYGGYGYGGFGYGGFGRRNII